MEFSRIKYSSLGKVLRPAWHYVQRFRRPSVKSNTEGKIYGNLQKVLAGDPFVHVADFQGNFHIGVKSHLFRRLVFEGSYEPELAALVKKYINPEKDAVDVGANIGFFTCLMAQRVSTNKVLSIEPTPGAWRRLQQNIEVNDIRANVIGFNGAVSSQRGVVVMCIVEDNEEYSSMGKISHPSVAREATESVTVPCETIDYLIESNQLSPGLIKVDVEGAEGFVFQGARETLRKHRPVIISELSDRLLASKGFRASEIVKELESLGYDVFDPFVPGFKCGSRPHGDILAIPN